MRRSGFVVLVWMLGGLLVACGGGGSSGGATSPAAPGPQGPAGPASALAGVTGRVVDAQGNAASGTQVRAVGAGSARKLGKGESVAATVTTEADGSFDIGSLEPGPYNLWAGDAGQSALASVELQAGTVGDAGTMVLQASGSIHGLALRSGSTDHSAIDVFVLDSPYLATTDPQGDYTLTDVPPGTFQLSATTRAGDASAQSPVTVTVEPGVAVEAPTLILVSNSNPVVSLLAPNPSLLATGLNELTVRWDAQANASGYDVLRSDNPTGPFVKLNTGPVVATEFADPNLVQLQEYFYEVQALDANGNAGPLSPVVSARAIPLHFSVPMDFDALDMRLPLGISGSGNLLAPPFNNGAYEARSYREFSLPGLSLLGQSDFTPQSFEVLQRMARNPVDNTTWWAFDGNPVTLASFNSAGQLLGTAALPPYPGGLPGGASGLVDFCISNSGRIIFVGGQTGSPIGWVTQYDSNGQILVQTNVPEGTWAVSALGQGFWDVTVDATGTIYALFVNASGWHVAVVSATGTWTGTWDLQENEFQGFDYRFRAIQATAGGRLHVFGIHQSNGKGFMQIYSGSGQLLDQVELDTLGFSPQFGYIYAAGTLQTDAAGNLYLTVNPGDAVIDCQLVKFSPFL